MPEKFLNLQPFSLAVGLFNMFDESWTIVLIFFFLILFCRNVWNKFKPLITLDEYLAFNSHISNLSRFCFYHIRALRHICPSISEDVARTIIACSLVGCRLDYANCILLGASATNIKRLQRLQDTLGRVTTRQHSRVKISNTLKDLHWLHVSWRIDYKIANLTYEVLKTSQPLYLALRIDICVTHRIVKS